MKDAAACACLESTAVDVPRQAHGAAAAACSRQEHDVATVGAYKPRSHEDHARGRGATQGMYRAPPRVAEAVFESVAPAFAPALILNAPHGGSQSLNCAKVPLRLRAVELRRKRCARVRGAQ